MFFREVDKSVLACVEVYNWNKQIYQRVFKFAVGLGMLMGFLLGILLTAISFVIFVNVN